MSILTHEESVDTISHLLFNEANLNSPISDELSQLLAPVYFSRSILTYAHIIEWIAHSTRLIACSTIRMILEKMDLHFRNAPGRIDRYYVKQTRTHTIITLFGEVTFKRTEYIDRHSGEPFIYVDREIGLLPRQRYDMTIAARAYQLYSNQNSMIKVGEIIGQEIFGFSTSDNNPYTISRQQIFKMLNLIKAIKVPSVRKDETPEILYIMADEKYISLQGQRKVWIEQQKAKGRSFDDYKDELHRKNFDEMVKLAVIFTGREQTLKKDGTPCKRPRWIMTGKTIVAYPDDSAHFWSNTLNTLNELYDMSKVKQIYILGDGATWIKNGQYELRSSDTDCKFAYDRYHLTKYIHKITKNENHRKLLLDYARHGDRKNFNHMINTIIEDDPYRENTIRDYSKFVTENMSGIQIMEEEVKFGCAMEQAIQHILASVFTSVPKAYASEHLHTYVINRINQQNKQNMIRLFITASDKLKDHLCKDDLNQIDLSVSDLDWSDISSTSPSEPDYHLNLRTNNIMKF